MLQVLIVRSFVHGGDTGTGGLNDGVYVLTIPGFVWFQIPDSNLSPRRSHTCNAAGNRQMIVIGGGNVDYRDPDPLTQGLGVFDMTDLRWSSSYNSSAAPYNTPTLVKNWYNKG